MTAESLDDKVRKEGFKSGLPFKIDFKRLIQKTMASRYYDPLQYQKDMLKLALENNPRHIEITDNKKKFAISFGGEGINEEEAIQLLKSVYFNKSGAGIGKFSHFGNALLSALSTNPQEINVLTHSDGESLAMKIDREYQPVFRTPRSKKKVNSISIRKEALPPLRKRAVDYLLNIDVSNVAENAADAVCGPTNLIRKEGRERRFIYKNSSLIDICRFSGIPVTINRKKASHGLHDPSAIFERKYELKDSTILLTLPESTCTRKAVTYLSGNIFIEKETIESSGHAPDIVISNPNFNTGISGGLIRDDVYKKAMEDVEKAKEMFYPDLLANLKNIDPKDRYEIRAVACHFLMDKLEGGAYRKQFGMQEKEQEDVKTLKSINMFIDTLDNIYSISDIEEIIKSRKTIPFTKDASHKNDPLVKNSHGIVMYFPSHLEEALFRDLFIDSWPKKSILGYRDTDMHNIDYTIMCRNLTIEEEKKTRKRERRDSLKKAARYVKEKKKPALITAGSAAAACTGYMLGVDTLSEIAAAGGFGAAVAGGSYWVFQGTRLAGRRAKAVYPKARNAVSSGFRSIGNGAVYVLKKIEPVFDKAVSRASSQKRRLSEIIKDYLEEKRAKAESSREMDGMQLPALSDAEKGFLTDLVFYLNKDIDGHQSIVDGYTVKDILLENSPADRIFRIALKHDDLQHMSRTKLWINTGSRRFAEAAEDYEKFPPSIINVLIEGENENCIHSDSRWVAYIEKKKCENRPRAWGIGLAYRHSLDMVFSSYCREEGSFKDKFGKLDDAEKKNIIKRVFKRRSGSSRQNALDEWLLREHDGIIKDAAEGRVSGRAVRNIMSLYEQERFGEAIQEFGLLTNEEIYDFFSSEAGQRFVDENKRRNNPLCSYMKRTYPRSIIHKMEADTTISRDIKDDSRYNISQDYLTSLEDCIKKKDIQGLSSLLSIKDENTRNLLFEGEEMDEGDKNILNSSYPCLGRILVKIIDHFEFEDPDFAKSLRPLCIETLL